MVVNAMGLVGFYFISGGRKHTNVNKLIFQSVKSLIRVYFHRFRDQMQLIIVARQTIITTLILILGTYLRHNSLVSVPFADYQFYRHLKINHTNFLTGRRSTQLVSYHICWRMLRPSTVLRHDLAKYSFVKPRNEQYFGKSRRWPK